MTNPETVECASCGWQGKWIDTDSSHCPDCGDECYALSEIYKNDADTPAPEGDKPASAENKHVCPKCSKPWEDHEFAVPAPYCP